MARAMAKIAKCRPCNSNYLTRAFACVEGIASIRAGKIWAQSAEFRARSGVTQIEGTTKVTWQPIAEHSEGDRYKRINKIIS